MRTASRESELLAIYLRDHHAMGSAGVALARRAVAHGRLPAARHDDLRAVAGEIAADLISLEAIMARVGVSPSTAKDALATVAERLGRLKLNGSIVSRSPLSTVLELEGLAAGICAKEAMWTALGLVADGDGRLDAAELRWLAGRAEQQGEVVEACRLEAVRAAFAAGPD